MSAVGRLAQLVAGVASRSTASQVLPAASAAASSWLKGSAVATSTVQSAFHTSRNSWQATAPTTAGGEAVAARTDGKFGHLADKDIWDEAWAYEPRFGTDDNPIAVPSLLSERIIGVTDPEDDTLVIWGIIREGEPPKQLVAGGEFFTLKRVDRVPKVGDVLGISLAPGEAH